MTQHDQLTILIHHGRLELRDNCGEVTGKLTMHSQGGAEKSVTAEGDLDDVVDALYGKLQALSFWANTCDR